MGPLLLIAAGLVGAVALRALLARYGPDRPSNWERRRYVHRPVARETLSQDALPQPERGPETVTCPNCRTTNDADFEFCRACSDPLDGS
jgi:hypothetical protein